MTTNASMTMNWKNVMWNLARLGESSVLAEEATQSAKDAEYLLGRLSAQFGMAESAESNTLLSVMDEIHQPLLNFVLKVAPVVDLAAECEVAGADQMKALYRTLNLATPVVAPHADAGLNAYLISGRESGDVDDSVEVVIAADIGSAISIFFMSVFDIEYDDSAIGRDDPPYLLVANDLIGTIDNYGRIVRR